MSAIEDILLRLLVDERRRAHAKHGTKSMESLDAFAERRLRIFVEEVGEVAAVLNDHDLGLLNEQTARANLREELLQVAAVTLTWLANLDGHVLGGELA
jgi:NTP pyrophosphatase (non-canonical NTP hydrolase)